jgi:hypothetical protein
VGGSAGDVVNELVMVEEDGHGQGGSAVGQVDSPSHLVAQSQDVSEKLEKVGLVVSDAPREQPAAALVDRDALVVRLSYVDASQIGAMRCLRRVPSSNRRPRCRIPTQRSVAIPNWQPSCRRAPSGQAFPASSIRSVRATLGAPEWVNHTQGSPSLQNNVGISKRPTARRAGAW